MRLVLFGVIFGAFFLNFISCDEFTGEIES